MFRGGEGRGVRVTLGGTDRKHIRTARRKLCYIWVNRTDRGRTRVGRIDTVITTRCYDGHPHDPQFLYHGVEDGDLGIGGGG